MRRVSLRHGKSFRGFVVGLGICLIVTFLVFMMPVGGEDMTGQLGRRAWTPLDLSAFSDERPAKPLRFLFMHHSCGGQLLASVGEIVGENCIYTTHPNGGGLRALLEEQGYAVHEASYGSELGADTDIFDWLPKFRDQMDKILSCAHQDTFHADGAKNDIVAFKSCYPNNDFTALGSPPGSLAGSELTVWNAKAAYSALLTEFQKHPEVLFVCLTAPPLNRSLPAEPLWKHLARKVMGKPRTSGVASGPLARVFNNWLASVDGWLSGYPLKNVVVFNYYDILTGDGVSDFAQFHTGNSQDSHPSAEGNSKAAQEFVPFLNRAARRAGLGGDESLNGLLMTREKEGK